MKYDFDRSDLRRMEIYRVEVVIKKNIFKVEKTFFSPMYAVCRPLCMFRRQAGQDQPHPVHEGPEAEPSRHDGRGGRQDRRLQDRGLQAQVPDVLQDRGLPGDGRGQEGGKNVFFM